MSKDPTFRKLFGRVTRAAAMNNQPERAFAKVIRKASINRTWVRFCQEQATRIEASLAKQEQARLERLATERRERDQFGRWKVQIRTAQGVVTSDTERPQIRIAAVEDTL